MDNVLEQDENEKSSVDDDDGDNKDE